MARDKQQGGQFKCSECGMIFGSQGELREHQSNCQEMPQESEGK